VFLPGESESIIIPKVSSALKLLQMVRNEAHRFAVTFHRSRRSKRVMNSELLTIKGFGETTVNKLLKEFGSLKKIREASIEDFARIIGKSKAKILKEFFLNH
jgi:excinuclease ABC subunit C